MKNHGDLSDEKIEVSYLKSNRKYFEDEWKNSIDKIIENSVYKGLKSHRVRAYMVKGGDDMRQEFFAMELIKQMAKIWKDEKLKLWVKTYDVIIFTRNSGFIEFIPDTITMSKLKKSGGSSLRSCYKHLFGNKLDHAIKNFVVSLAGYSIIQYLFQIKDRHNGNIMIDS
jgi:phosphatidylinositol 4-kinase